MAAPYAAPLPTPPAAPTQPTRTNGFAIASMVLGIVWVWGIGAILAVIFGYKSKREIDASSGQQTGRGMAIAGIVLGWIGIAGAGLLMIAILSAGDVATTEFERTRDAISGTGLDLGDVNSDPSDGECDIDRYIQDPDC